MEQRAKELHKQAMLALADRLRVLAQRLLVLARRLIMLTALTT